MGLIIKGLWRADGLDDDACYSARRGGNVMEKFVPLTVGVVALRQNVKKM